MSPWPTSTALARPTTGVGFVDALADHGDRSALIARDGLEVSYAELADRVAGITARLGPERRLVLAEMAPDVDSVAAYLGAIAGGHPVVAVTAGAASALRSVTEAFDPDVVVGVDGSLAERRAGTRHELHPDLALLLSTSGTTGSAKLVRLSQRNLDANAAAIAEYLGLGPDERPITTLPLGYCYGLSVLHSHLLVGASIVLEDRSVVDEGFWTRFRDVGATSFAGVPHTFDLLDQVGFAERDVPTLRTVTQAGGRLAPDRVRRFAELGRDRGFRLVVMYGQTEATARMAYLPPELAEHRPDAVGVAVPGGSFEVRPVDGLVADGAADVGELVYHGPNVMLGYAREPADLARARDVHELRTGDLGRIAGDGLVEITGRLGRFTKLYGLRVDLDQVERMAAEAGVEALCAGDDGGVVVAARDLEDPARLAAELRGRLDLPPAGLCVVAVDDLPRTPTGKPDYPAVLATGRSVGSDGSDDDRHPIDALLGTVLGAESVADEDTFVGLGGDSLSYVEVAVGLERILGRTPHGWHTMAVGELRALEPSASRVGRLDTTVVLRGVAIVGVVAGHTGLLPTGGGAHVLLAVAGMNAARFTVGARTRDWWRTGLRQVAKVALPTIAFLAAAALVVDGLHPTTVGLLSGYAGEGTWRYRYWFIEVLVVVLLVATALLTIPGARRVERRWPVALALAVTAAALALRDAQLGAPGWDELKVHAVAWLFALGWAAERARTPVERVAVSVAVVVAVPGLFGGLRDVVLLVGLGLLIWVPTLPVPRRLHAPLGALAAASLAIYLLHWPVLDVTEGLVPAPLAVAAGLAVGLAAWRWAPPLWRAVQRYSRRVSQRIATAPQIGGR